MNERSYTFESVDQGLTTRDQWGPGPWQHEPDKIVWIDDTTQLDCMILRNRMGALCGYVGLPADHPWYEHGGLTFAAHCAPSAREDEQIVCHTELPGRPTRVWWIGFDCVHGFDFAPALIARERLLGLPMPPMLSFQDSYRTVAYVRSEVEHLALQAHEAQQ